MAFASTANAGITIPAGDWTVDIGGNVNAFYTRTTTDYTSRTGVASSADDANTIGTGLLPAAVGIGAKTRQNDIDVAFQFTFFTGTNAGANGDLGTGGGRAASSNTLNIRQAFLTFGDASWGTVKMGRDLGIYGSDAILSDMTLLGVGVGGPAQGSSTLGRIGSGYMYADWKGQISYTSPNWNGFQFAAGVMENFAGPTGANRDNLAYEGKITYDFAANDVTGRVWASGITQKNEGTSLSYTSKGLDVGAKASYSGATLVGYYYDGENMDSQNTSDAIQGNATPTLKGAGGLFALGGVKTKDSGGYVQATFAVPGIGTKLGASWGVSNSKAEAASSFDIENESWIVGAYHPLTKSLNLVAEYTNQEIKNSGTLTGTQRSKVESDTISLGAIMFF